MGAGTPTLPPMTLPQHNLARYLRVRLEVAGGRLRWRAPHTVLGVLPIGVRRLSVPLGEIGSIRTRHLIRPQSLLVGLAAIVATPFFAPWWVSVIAGPAGAWVVLVSLGPTLEVTTRSGARHRAGVCFSHEFDAGLFVDAVEDMAGGGGGEPPRGSGRIRP